MNLERFKAAQERGDNYSIKLYELRLKLDDLDKKKMEIRTAIQKLKQQYEKI
jgi:predicted ATP-grasp superfamily ATP-dependent carboligase